MGERYAPGAGSLNGVCYACVVTNSPGRIRYQRGGGFLTMTKRPSSFMT